MKLLSLLLLFALPIVVQAGFICTTNNGAISITGYTGSGRAVSIPSRIHGLPVTGIDYYAFGSNITSVEIPSSVTFIGLKAFANCSRLRSIKVNARNPVFSSIAGVLFDQSKTALLRFPYAKVERSYIVPKSVTEIAVGAFDYCTKLASITILEDVTNIWSGAFFQCVGLTNATIGNGVTGIGDDAFYSCTGLSRLTIGTNVTSIGIYAFGFCGKLRRITIPNSVTSIGSGAFYQCVGLTNVTIGNGVTTIGDDAFYSCTKLTSVTIGNSVTYIGSLAFFGCSELVRVTIPNNVTQIGGEAFYDCTNLTELYFKGNAPTLGYAVFNDDNLATVYFLLGTTGWDPAFGGRPTMLWNPTVSWNTQIKTQHAKLGAQTDRFGFTIIGPTNLVIVVEACTNMFNPIWFSVQTNTLTSGYSEFNDPERSYYPNRFYRLRSP